MVPARSRRYITNRRINKLRVVARHRMWCRSINDVGGGWLIAQAYVVCTGMIRHKQRDSTVINPQRMKQTLACLRRPAASVVCVCFVRIVRGKMQTTNNSLASGSVPRSPAVLQKRLSLRKGRCARIAIYLVEAYVYPIKTQQQCATSLPCLSGHPDTDADMHKRDAFGPRGPRGCLLVRNNTAWPLFRWVSSTASTSSSQLRTDSYKQAR